MLSEKMQEFLKGLLSDAANAPSAARADLIEWIEANAERASELLADD